jgi:mono/diheme cytochrome c family protein
MERVQRSNKFKLILGVVALTSLGLLAIGSTSWVLHAAEETSVKSEKAEAEKTAEAKAVGGEELCCKPGDQTPPLELVKKIPPGGLHSPYQDWAKLAKDEELVKQFRLPGCNECHGGGGGGGFCPALSQGVWFWGNTDDVLFRLISLGSADLEKQGFTRIQYGTVHAGMPMMGHTIKTADHLWKIIAFIRSINPPGTNPPEKVVAPRMHPIGETPPG